MKAAFYTLGCKVNQYETEYMAELLRNAGFEIVKENDEADYYIVNSCTVTATADQKTRKSIRKFKVRGPLRRRQAGGRPVPRLCQGRARRHWPGRAGMDQMVRGQRCRRSVPQQHRH